jgi:adenylate cyclase
MDVDRAVILLLDRKTGQLERKAAKFRSGIPTDDRFYSTTIANSVQQNAKALLITDAHVDQRFNTSYSILKQAIHASMCVPLKPREQVIGVLYADNLSMANVYSEEDLEFLIALANQAAIAIENAELSNKIQSAAVMQAKLERFFPQSVSKKLKEEGSLDIVDTEVTALFADITGFTELCSRMEPRFVIEMLNEYFQVMVEDIVFQYEGTLEKYIGDALLAVWGAPYQQPDDADRAVQAAIAMQRALAQLNEQWKKRRNLQIQIHIGLNTGKVAAGNIGSPKLVQYGTIGDTTNVSSRICSAAKPGEILISQSTLDKLRDPSLLVEKIPPVLVKGKNQPLQLYRLLWDV